jgi:hypothetical protein
MRQWIYIYINIFLTSALIGGEWSASRPNRFTPVERAHGTHWIGGWVGLRAGLDDVEKRKFLTLLGHELRTLGRPALIAKYLNTGLDQNSEILGVSNIP